MTIAIALSMIACFAIQMAQRHLNFDIDDEGFLWYGAQRVLHGELPVRDFQAYDPARYLWVAAWMTVLHDDGLMTMRLANAALAAVTVALVLAAIVQERPRPGAGGLVLAGLVVSLWLIPFYKVSDSFAVALLLAGLSTLIRSPSPARFALAGACLGVASTVGINHALYGSVACVVTLCWTRPARLAPAIGCAVVGGLLGYAPMLALDAFAPGFLAAFVDGIRQLQEAGTTNLTLPLPALTAMFKAGGAGPTFGEGLETSLYAVFFWSLPAFWLFFGWRLWRDAGARPTTAAGLFLSVPYAHYAWSRADWRHVAVSILPVLAVLLARALATDRPALRRCSLGAITLATCAMTLRGHPARLLHRRDGVEWIAMDGQPLLVRSADAEKIRAVGVLARLAGGGPFFSGPYLPGAYALTRHRSPVREIYMLFPSTPARQRAEIDRIKAADVHFALLSDESIDYRPDLGLVHTHPLLMQYLEHCFDTVIHIQGANHFLIRRRDTGDGAHESRSSEQCTVPE